MKLVRYDEMVRRYIPNVFDSVDDEAGLFEKIAPQLTAAEAWVTEELIGEGVRDYLLTVLDCPLYDVVCGIIVSEAFKRSIPLLDLVLTPNGFGVVSNNNVAPASKERVASLKQQLAKNKSELINRLPGLLCSLAEWEESEAFKRLTASFLQLPSDADLLPYAEENPDRWEALQRLREEAKEYEAEIADGYISAELSEQLRKKHALGTSTDAEERLYEAVRSNVLMAVKSGRLNIGRLMNVVDYLRRSGNELWQCSETAKLFEPPVFENKKASGGYFF